ncbi:MAG: hypothetical protein QM820_47070 [Minicystis sp.]
MPSWFASVLERFRSKKPEVDPLNVALVDAYANLTERERDHMVGRLADNAYGIQRRPLYVSTRYQPRDRDEILAACESGQLLRLAFFLDFLKQDGLVSGLMGTRTGGLLRQPVLYSGDPFLVEQLKGVEPTYDDSGLVVDPGKPGLWQRMVPTAELSKILSDGLLAGVGVGELVADETGLPVLRHLDLHWVRYDYQLDRWIYQGPGGTYEIVPGDGRWVLFTPKGQRRPWIHAAWFPLAYPVISKAGTALDRLRWQGQLADPLKVIESSKASSPRMRDYLLNFIKEKWRRSPGIVTLPDEKVYLVESNGRGFDVFSDAEDRADREIQYILSGQTVTGDGNKGFSTGDIYEAIKNDSDPGDGERGLRDRSPGHPHPMGMALLRHAGSSGHPLGRPLSRAAEGGGGGDHRGDGRHREGGDQPRKTRPRPGDRRPGVPQGAADQPSRPAEEPSHGALRRYARWPSLG